MRYIPHTEADVQRMLERIGVDSLDELFVGLPEKHRLERALNLPAAESEQLLTDHLQALSE